MSNLIALQLNAPWVQPDKFPFCPEEGVATADVVPEEGMQMHAIFQ
jgi:hypothetical protein